MGKVKSRPKSRGKKAARPRLAERLAGGLDELRRFFDGEPDTGVNLVWVTVPPADSAVSELKAAREEAGLSVAKVAKSVGVTAEQLARLEAGKVKKPTVDLLEKYAAAVGKELRLSVVSKGK